jgi:ADP-ribose pyrophosphatase YjhB (NUDIX family)
MLRRVRILMFRGYRRLPRRLRRFVVRRVAPSYSVGAMCVIERDDGALLLVRQSYRDGWGCAGGLLRRGEEPIEGAHREAEEEVGLTLDIDEEPQRAFIDPRARRIDVVFRCRVRPPVPDEITPRSAEIVEVRWFERGHLPPLQNEVARAFSKLGLLPAEGALGSR